MTVPNLYSWIVNKYGIGNTNNALILMMVGVVLCIVVPYLIGSLNPAIILSRKIYHDDIRSHGSGNAGTTNTLRTYGKKMAIIIFSLDLFKAALAVVFGLFTLAIMGGAIAGLFVIVGHMFPIYYRFKGGKGVACLAMVVLILSPISFLILMPLFILIVIMSRFVSLGSIMAVMLLPVIHNAFYVAPEGSNPSNGWTTVSFLLIMILVVYMHRENIKRLREGKESKISFGSKKDKNAKGDKNDQP